MVEVRDLSGWYRLPEWLRWKCLAALKSTLDQQAVPSESVVTVTHIVYDAEESHVSMDVRITPVLTTVNLEVTLP